LSVGPRVLRTPIQASNANAVAERWIGTVRRERLNHLLITGHGRLLAVLHSYVQQYRRDRPIPASAVAFPAVALPISVSVPKPCAWNAC
jgi:hypothetical protein